MASSNVLCFLTAWLSRGLDFLLSSLEAVDMSDPCEQVRSCIAFYDPVSEATQHYSIGQVVISPPGLKGADIISTF